MSPRVLRPYRKLSEKKVAHIRERIGRGTATAAELSIRFNVSPSAIYYAATGQTWKHVDEPPVSLGEYRRRHYSPDRAGKEHKEQTLTWISKSAMQYLTSRKLDRREAVGRVLDRIIKQLGGSRISRRTG